MNVKTRLLRKFKHLTLIKTTVTVSPFKQISFQIKYIVGGWDEIQ